MEQLQRVDVSMSQETSQQSFLGKTISLIGHIGADANDSNDVRLRKVLFVGSVLFFAIPSSALLGLIYFVVGVPLAAFLLFAFIVLSLLFIVLLGLMPRFYPLILFCELLLVLLIPFLTTLALGGLANLSLAIVWSFMCPLGALVMTERRIAQRWLVAFIFLLGLLIVLQPHLSPPNNISPALTLIAAILNLGTVSIVTFILLNYFVAQRDLFQEKSDNLLLNILPKEIAEILKDGDKTIADHYDSATVLFADIVGSTPLFSDLEPEEAVDWLNEVFSMFDHLVEKYGLEKIRTIGDNYMVASGVPTSRPDHAQAMALLALDMVRGLEELPTRNGKRIAFRVGINSGPLVAGVIGQIKFHYDLWGDTVNIASRMESHGEAGKVHITSATYELLKNDFECVRRGTIPIKGKGEMETWYVVAHKR